MAGAAKEFALEIVTPRKMVFSGDVESFSAPGVLGGFQVLRSHAPMLAEFGVGEMKIRKPGGSEMHFATGGGVVEVKENKVVCLADSAEQATEIDAARAEASGERARTRLRERTPETDLERARRALSRSTNRLKISRRG